MMSRCKDPYVHQPYPTQKLPAFPQVTEALQQVLCFCTWDSESWLIYVSTGLMVSTKVSILNKIMLENVFSQKNGNKGKRNNNYCNFPILVCLYFEFRGKVPIFVAICLSLSTLTEKCLLILLGWHIYSHWNPTKITGGFLKNCWACMACFFRNL